ncbi:hypothetical protein R5R35_011783 [Gryllus longicercus]|uniref:Accessory gland protein n=1 Tax=Gryllus longicercus TaxID=2509291 RepID=A0AAN9ZC90_9ORTH
MSISTCWVIIAAAVSNGLVQAHPATKALSRGVASQTDVQMNCTQQEVKCLAKGQIPHADGRCYTPLQRGPCPRGQRIVWDPEGVPGRRGRCATQPCLFGATQLVPHEGRCLSPAIARAVLCASGEIHFDATGSPACGGFPGWGQALQRHIRCFARKADIQLFSSDKNTQDVVRIASSLCAKDDSGKCVPESTGIDPKIVLSPEE